MFAGSADAPRRSGTVVVFRRLDSDPRDELLDLWHFKQRLYGRVLLRQFSFGEVRVDVSVADAMEPFRFDATLALGHKVKSIEL